LPPRLACIRPYADNEAQSETACSNDGQDKSRDIQRMHRAGAHEMALERFPKPRRWPAR